MGTFGKTLKRPCLKVRRSGPRKRGPQSNWNCSHIGLYISTHRSVLAKRDARGQRAIPLFSDGISEPVERINLQINCLHDYGPKRQRTKKWHAALEFLELWPITFQSIVQSSRHFFESLVLVDLINFNSCPRRLVASCKSPEPTLLSTKI